MSSRSHYVIRSDIIAPNKNSSHDREENNLFRHSVLAKYVESADNIEACKKYIFSCLVRQTLEHANPIIIGSYHKGQKIPIHIPDHNFDFCMVFGSFQGEIISIISIMDEGNKHSLFC